MKDFAFGPAQELVWLRTVQLKLLNSFIFVLDFRNKSAILSLELVLSLLFVSDDLLFGVKGVKPALYRPFLHHYLLGKFRNFAIFFVQLSL